MTVPSSDDQIMKRSSYHRVTFLERFHTDLEPSGALSSLLSERRKPGASGRIASAHRGKMAAHRLPLIADAEDRCSWYPPSQHLPRFLALTIVSRVTIIGAVCGTARAAVRS